MPEALKPKYCHLREGDTLTLVVTPLYVIMSLCTILGNSLVIVSVMLFNNLRTPTNNFVVALALADLMVGLSIPYYISFYFDVPYTCDALACQMRYYICIMGSILSLVLLIGAAVDRYIAIMHPLQYPVLMTQKVSCVAIALIYIYVGEVTAIPFEFSSAGKDLSDMKECDLFYVYTPIFTAMSIVFHLVLNLVVTFIIYGRIFRVARRQNRAVAALHLDNKETQLTLMMVLILGVSLLSAVPYLIVIGVRYMEGDEITSDYEFQLSQIKKVTVLFFYMKSAVNPIIYGWKNRDFRAAFYRLFTVMRCKKTAVIESPPVESHQSTSATIQQSQDTEINHCTVHFSDYI